MIHIIYITYIAGAYKSEDKSEISDDVVSRASTFQAPLTQERVREQLPHDPKGASGVAGPVQVCVYVISLNKNHKGSTST